MIGQQAGTYYFDMIVTMYSSGRDLYMVKWEMVKKMYRTVGKVHHIMAVFAVCVLSVLLAGIPAAVPAIAAAQTSVMLTAEGNQAEVSLEMPLGNQSEQQDYGGIKALQLGFQVNILHGEGENNQVSFLFDEGITSSVKQFSYQEETGLLQIYLSGEQNLCESSRIVLGKIVLEADASADVTASIRVVEDSLKTVNDAFDLQEQPFHAPEMVQVTTGGKQEEKNNGAYGGAAISDPGSRKDGTEEAAGTETGSLQDGADQSEGSSKGKSAGAAGLVSDGSETQEEEPLLRLVETEKQSRFSLKNFSIQNLLADKKARIVLGVVAVAAAALILGTVIRLVHNRKKKKKKTWW